jgi:predicted ATPase
MLGVLLDRERELAEIGELIEAAREGSGGLVVVQGPAGIGKTRLLEEWKRPGSTETGLHGIWGR